VLPVVQVSRQQTVISQASQALNLCCSTIEFSGSAEQVEGERLLLVASKYHSFIVSELKESASWNTCCSNWYFKSCYTS